MISKTRKCLYHRDPSSTESAAKQSCKICWLFNQFLTETDCQQFEFGMESEEVKAIYLDIFPSRFWRRRKVSGDGTENLYEGYESPFVEWDEWYIGLQIANSGRLTPPNVPCIVALVFPRKYYLLRS